MKARLVNRTGPVGFTLAYSILSPAMLIWLILAAGNAPYVGLRDQALWQRHVIFGGVLFICLLLALAIARSALHILSNGDLAHVILLEVFAGFTLIGIKIVDRRKQSLLGEAEWLPLRSKVAPAPLLSIHGSRFELLSRIANGVLGFTLCFALHLIILGVSW